LRECEKGITLISLVITIVVLAIITGIAISASTDSIKSAKRTAFITELEMIQEKVNTIYEKRKLNKEDIEYYDSLGQDISKVEASKLAQILKGQSKEGYLYFSKEDLKKLDLDNLSQDVIINFNTKDVISVIGIEIEGNTYYKLLDIPNYAGQKIDYIDKNTKVPTFDVEVNKMASSWQVVLKNMTYNSNVARGTLSYKLSGSDNWIIAGEKTYFEVAKPRIIRYKIH
jgi:Tfp pilus assembly protein PilE